MKVSSMDRRNGVLAHQSAWTLDDQGEMSREAGRPDCE